MLQRFEYGTKPMGDFVGKQTPKRAAMPLFQEELPEQGAPPHRLRGFDLYTENGLAMPSASAAE